MSPGMSLASIDAILILGCDDGTRVFARYFTAPHHAPPGTDEADSSTGPPNPYADPKAQKSFEKGLLEKTAKQTGDIILYDSHVVLYKMESDAMIYVVGGAEENEIMLYNVMLALRDALHLLFKTTVDKRTILENYDLVALAIDEIVDAGIVLETDPTIVVQRVSRAPTQDSTNLSRMDPFSEQAVNNLAQIGRAKLSDWLRQGL